MSSTPGPNLGGLARAAPPPDMVASATSSASARNLPRRCLAFIKPSTGRRRPGNYLDLGERTLELSAVGPVVVQSVANALIHCTVYSIVSKKSVTATFSLGAWILESGRHTPAGDTVGMPR